MGNNVEVENRDELLPSSRYKNARYYRRIVDNVGLRIEPSIWQYDEIPENDNDLFTEVGSGERGRLDLIARRIYRLEELYWVIAFANDIVDPFEEIVPGMKLRCPHPDWVATNVLS